MAQRAQLFTSAKVFILAMGTKLIMHYVEAFQGQLYIDTGRLCRLVWSQTVLTASSDTNVKQCESKHQTCSRCSWLSRLAIWPLQAFSLAMRVIAPPTRLRKRSCNSLHH